MQSNLQTSLYNYIKTTNTFNTSIGGRFWFNSIPKEQNVSFPYAIGTVISQIPTRDSCDKWERFVVQITIYQTRINSSENILSISEKAMSLLDDCKASLSITGYTCIDVDRTSSFEIPLDNVEYRQYQITYSIEIQKN